MKNKPAEISPGQEADKLKEIPKWTRQYAQNQEALPALAVMAIISCMFAGILIPAHFAQAAYRAGNLALYRILMIVMIAAAASLTYFSLSGRMKKLIKRISNHHNNQEGNISISSPEAIKKKQRVEKVSVALLALCILCTLGFLGTLIPFKYFQPVSAIYLVPFFTFMYFWFRPRYSSTMLFFPMLYAAHAILIIMEVIPDKLVWFNMLSGMGYAFLTYAIGYLYNRHVLKKLKNLTHLEGEPADGD
ncbi:MAG: hypothetical protein JXA52_05395 [Planctomycetes bacterium]|nr:hypothetical protein [Planctomycetota bacterium]